MTQPDLFVPPPPFVRTSKTSRAAAESLPTSVRGAQQQAVLDFIRACGINGATDQEIQEHEHIGESSERPRRREIEKAGLIKDSGRTRPTTSGRQAAVWIAAEFAAAT